MTREPGVRPLPNEATGTTGIQEMPPNAFGVRA